jgi:hypothetical protein
LDVRDEQLFELVLEVVEGILTAGLQDGEGRVREVLA